MKRLKLGDGELFLLPTVKGLGSEVKKVEKGFHDAKPDTVALPLAEEGLQDLARLADGDKDKLVVAHFEETYYKHLARFGEVRVPPPNFERAYLLAKESGARLVPIDIPEEAYTEIYLANVSTMSWLFEGRRINKLAKKRFDSATPEEFTLDWDREVNRVKGFRALERTREEHMARQLRELATGGGRILAILEYERADGVLALLERKKE